jgi:hypothetical protein
MCSARQRASGWVLPMTPDRTEQLRERAAECLALARKAILPEVRMGLLMMAQKLHEMAKQDPLEIDRFDWAVRAFNEDQIRRH